MAQGTRRMAILCYTLLFYKPHKTIMPSDFNHAPHPTFSKVRTATLCLFMIMLLFVCQTGFVWLIGDINQMTLINASHHGGVVSLSIVMTACVMSLTALLLIYQRVRGQIWQFLGVRPFYWRTLAVCTWWLALFLVLSEFITHALGRTPLDFMDALVGTAWLPLLVVATVVIAPIYEELVFRGMMFGMIQDACSTHGIKTANLIASVISSLLFAIIHVQYEWFEMGVIFVLAMIFCYARIHCRSLIAPMLLHILNNGVAMVVYLYTT